MKIQCNVCEAAEANVLCCADEAALCWGCDQKVHAANKLASKHQRVPLSSSSAQMPKCDICQETVGYFFCLEDRALLCRKCDVAIHTANSLVSAHQRFLLTGVKVGLEAAEPGTPSSSSGKLHSQSNEKNVGPDPRSQPKNGSVSQTGQCGKSLPVEATVPGDYSSSKMPFNGGSVTGSVSQWHLDDFLALSDYNPNYNFMDGGSSKADSGKLGSDSDFSPVLRAADAELDGSDEFLGQAPDSFWAVPQMPSPPTASGLHWPRSYNENISYSTAYVPDISSSPRQSFQYRNSNARSSKRRRHS
ncbi:B-box zinc finger protein 22-like [Andrographis paniculata]|uniref:B-box zinc finger protein 22-like n=1 Tax=Andrographis paniculata TaxID=175694 RepID=UPI0021E6D95D|nr:B-box zinc finger protein 22-like [Andrographis paniculata]XP_051152220.1 B-box zinc finger protein 22-like [Andrographis paniculata]XP_051152221.1 B-box zinc finger protein 22-like [Andrographis paniculata]XP_051152222.1 B-box zinc finger protein 22-like [Andrographis paniculata]